MAKRCGGARCICTGSRSFTYGALRSYENLMKESSRIKPRPVMPNNSRVYERPVTPVKG